jgi:transposase InsO family protein
MNTLTKIEVAWNLWKEKIKAEQIAQRCEVDRATVYRWIKRFKTCGIKRTLKLHKIAHTRPRKRLDPVIKRRILILREKHKQCCGQKIQRYLKREYGNEVSLSTIYRVLAEKYKLSSKYRKQKAYGKVPKASKAREVVQVDTVDFGEIFAYTFVDTYTREVNVVLRPTLEAIDGKEALIETMSRFKRVKILQTDGGSEFKAEFESTVPLYAKTHRISRPYKKNEQSYIESFNRTLRKECLGWNKYSRNQIEQLQKKVDNYLEYYHNERLHIGLDYQTPKEFLQFLSHLI